MGFIFGVLFGAAVSGGGVPAPPTLGTIPFRCLAAFEISDADYRMCRTTSLQHELYTGTTCRAVDIANDKDPCSLDRALTWEIAGLHSLKSAIEHKQP